MAESGDSRSEFVNKIEDLLKADNCEEASQLFNDAEYESEIKNNSWELIPVISAFLSDEYNVNKPHVFKCCEHFMSIVAEKTNPEEALLQIIEEIEECTDDVKFLALIKPLERIILRIPRKRFNSLAWGFNAVQTFLNKCEPPENEKLVGKEKLLLDTNDKVIRIIRLYNKIIVFYNRILSNLSLDDEESPQQRALICKFLVDLLGKPLVYLDMEVFDNIKSYERMIAEKIVRNILKLNCDPITLLVVKKKEKEFYSPNILGTGSLFYLIYTEYVCINQIPIVYHPLYLFHQSLHLCNALLDSDHNILVEKGLKLADSLLERAKFLTLDYLMLDCEQHKKMVLNLARVIVYNNLENLRQFGIQIYKKYVNSFDSTGFYMLIYNLVSNLNHSGLIGYTITIYKDKLILNLSSEEGCTYFKGEKLLMMLKKFCFLHKNEESDFIELSDQIIATLNLLRFLALRDKDNITGIWNHFKILDEIYFKPLRLGIDLSRAHYKLKVKEVNEESKVKTNQNSDVTVEVAGVNLNMMPNSEKIKVLESSLTVFDVIESLLVRLLECIEQYSEK